MIETEKKKAKKYNAIFVVLRDLRGLEPNFKKQSQFIGS